MAYRAGRRDLIKGREKKGEGHQVFLAQQQQASSVNPAQLSPQAAGDGHLPSQCDDRCSSIFPRVRGITEPLERRKSSPETALGSVGRVFLRHRPSSPLPRSRVG